MLYNCFLKSGIVYIPTVVKMQTGVYSDEEPVAVVPVADVAGLHRGLRDAIGRGNVIVPNPPKDQWPPPVLLKYSAAQTWPAFARGTSQWSIVEEPQGTYRIVGHRKHQDGYWVQDPEQRSDFPPGTSVDSVIDRMIAILQEAAKNRRAGRPWLPSKN
jgi:hypothetical protein